MDAPVALGVGAIEPGGLTFIQAAILLNYLARNKRLAGIVFTEYQHAISLTQPRNSSLF
ncbi:MAG: hypothetical protein ACT6U0_26415 [Shinella sp.]|uniref:hypothetical protein n=1 Tax=Shinella sp. TaxID=1870904 RepID=UPI004035782A